MSNPCRLQCKERFRTITSAYYRGADGIIMVLDSRLLDREAAWFAGSDQTCRASLDFKDVSEVLCLHVAHQTTWSWRVLQEGPSGGSFRRVPQEGPSGGTGPFLENPNLLKQGG